MRQQGDSTLLEWERQTAEVSASSESSLDKLLRGFRSAEGVAGGEEGHGFVRPFRTGVPPVRPEEFRAAALKINTAADALVSRCRAFLPRLQTGSASCKPQTLPANEGASHCSARSGVLLELEGDEGEGPLIELGESLLERGAPAPSLGGFREKRLCRLWGAWPQRSASEFSTFTERHCPQRA